MNDQQFSDKSRLVTLILAWFLGIFGVHRFYVGKVGTGILMLITIGGFGIWWLVDIIFVLIGSFKDSKGQRIYRWFEPDSI